MYKDLFFLIIETGHVQIMEQSKGATRLNVPVTFKNMIRSNGPYCATNLLSRTHFTGKLYLIL